MDPGAYPVQVIATLGTPEGPQEIALDSFLLVYDPAAKTVPVVLVARVTGQPLSDANGLFVADPGRFTRARDDVSRLASWVLGRRTARVTLAVSPLLLEEWRDIADGYEFTGPEGAEKIPADAPVPRSYLAALELLSRAVDTGRLELLSLGYADPDLSQLRAHGRIDDVAAQYARGSAAISRAAETSASSGTASAGGCVPAAAASMLVDRGVRYAVVSDTCAVSRDATAESGVFAVGSTGLTALVADSALTDSLRTGEASQALATALVRNATGERSPLIINGELGASGGTVADFTRVADTLSTAPWLQLRLGGEVAAVNTRSTVKLHTAPDNDDSPTGYWDDVAGARAASGGLSFAMGATDPTASSA
ncbi:MAG: hypothetical protein FDZ75_06475, partial [Actinobacteria bacterium]